MLASTACKRDRAADERASSASKTTTSSADVATLAQAASERIADARCRRAVACQEVGPARRHESFETCRGLYASEVLREVGPSACPRGLDESQVSRCAAAIERTGCLDPVGVLERLEDCRASKICLSAAAP
ncbi:MAG: hypothetical protein KF894_03115 [Labilithrix sp.]|nr:hypothetical protein [Labilithrix sp.]